MVLPNFRYAITDSSGEAQFDLLSVWDISGENATWKFYFVAGDRHTGLYIKTNLTATPHTYIPSVKYEIVTQPSKFISSKTYFTTYPKIRITTYVPRVFYIINVQLTELYNTQVYDTPYSDYTTKFLDNSLCFLYLDGSTMKTLPGWSSKKVTSKILDTEQYEVEFKKLQWAVWWSGCWNYYLLIVDLAW